MEDLKDIAVLVLGGLMTLLGWLGNREIKRIDKAIERSVSRDEFNETVRRFEKAQDTTIKSLERVHERIDGVLKQRA